MGTNVSRHFLYRWLLLSLVVFFVLWGAGCGGVYYADCRENNDCKGGRVCALGYCQNAGLITCGLDGSCPDGYACDRGVCQVTSCQTESDCEPGYTCHPTGKCVSKSLCVPTVQETTVSHHPTGDVLAMAVSPDGGLLAVGRTLGQGQTAIRLQRTDTKQLVRVVFVPQSPLLGLAFHPNGKQLAVQSAQVVSIWNVETGKQLQTYLTTQNMVRGIAYSASGKLLFAPTQKGAVMWNTNTHKQVVSSEAPGGKQHSVRLLPDETVLLVGGTNALLRLDVVNQTSKNVTFQEPADATISLQHISVDGRWVANHILADKKVYVLNTETGKLVTTIALNEQTVAAAFVTAMVFSPDGSWLAIGSRGRLARWSLIDGQMIQEMPAPSTGYAAPSYTQMVLVPKRQALAYSHDKGLVFWDFGGNKSPVTVTRSMVSKQSLWHEASSALWVTDAAGTVQSWKRPASSPTLLSYQGFGSGNVQLAYQKGGNSLVSVSDDGLIQTWDLTQNPPVAVARFAASWRTSERTFHEALLGPTGRWVVVRQWDDAKKQGLVRLWNVEQHKWETTLFEGEQSPQALSFRGDGNALIASFDVDYQLRVWELPSGKEVLSSAYYRQNTTLFKSGRPTGKTQKIYDVALTPDGQTMAVAVLQAGNGIDMWSQETTLPTLLPEDAGFSLGFRYVRFSPNGRWLAAVNDDVVYLYDAKSGVLVRKFHFKDVIALDFRFDSKIIVCISSKKSIAWELETGKTVLTLNNGTSVESPYAVRFHPRGHTIAISKSNSHIRLWTCPQTR